MIDLILIDQNSLAIALLHSFVTSAFIPKITDADAATFSPHFTL